MTTKSGGADKRKCRKCLQAAAEAEAEKRLSTLEKIIADQNEWFRKAEAARINNDPSGLYVATDAFMQNNPWWPRPWHEAYGRAEER